MDSTFAQSSRTIDSLKALEAERQGADLFDVYYDLTFEFLGASDLEQSYSYIEKAQKISYNIGDSLRIVKSGRVGAQLLKRLDRTSECIQQYLKILPIAERNKFISEVKYILNGLGAAYTWQSEYDRALSYHLRGLVLKERDGNPQEIFETLNNIGLVYFKLKDYDQALSYYFRSLEYEKRVENSGFRESLLINIGLCYNQLQKYSEAREYINRALTFCGDKCANPTMIEGQFGLGVSYYIQAEAEKNDQFLLDAKRYFLKSLAVSQAQEHKRWQLDNLVYLARIYTRVNNYDSAKLVLNEAESIAKSTNYNLLTIEVYKGFSVFYNKTNDFKMAAEYQQKYISLKDSIYSEDLIKNISKVRTAFEERENIATIADNAKVIRQQRDLNISFAIIALLASLLILMVQRSNRQIKRVNVALSDAKNTIEEQNARLQVLNTDLDTEVKSKTADLEKANQSLHRVVDELDNFIYKTSHDIRGPLASLKGICNIALLDVKDETALKYLSKLDLTADKMNTILTRLLIVNQINNSNMKVDEVINFESVISDVLLLERKKGLPPRLAIRTTIQPDVEFRADREFMRIILENLIDNAIKFYNDSDRTDPFVEVHIETQQKWLLIRVIDNGIGISEIHPDKIFQMFSRASERSETGGIGLFITKTAVEKLGGTVSLKTTPEGYTEFFVRFNLDGTAMRRTKPGMHP